MGEKYIAHSKKNADVVVYQPLKEHCIHAAEYASAIMEDNGFKYTAYLAGVLHDMGKYSDLFQNYLIKASMGEKVCPGSVNHTFAGTIYVLEKFHGKQKSYEAMTSEIIAYAIGAHHGEFDVVDLNNNNGFAHRLDTDREEIQYAVALKRYFIDCISEQRIDSLFLLAVNEVKYFFEKVRCDYVNSNLKSSVHYQLGMLTRMVLSAVIYADRMDTIEYMYGLSHPNESISTEFWHTQLLYLEKKLMEGKKDTLINRQRQAISDQCKQFAMNGNGIYRLSVPTGAGKTLSTLRYALTLAEMTRKKRIIFAIPLLSVMDQNSEVIRNHIEEKDQIGEYHSNIIHSKDNGVELQEIQLLEEFWEKPIIIATLYQLLMNLFSNRTTFIARMHAFADSVIIIDEAQSIPLKMTYMFNMAANFLTCFFHTTIVLSSATQPCFENVKFPLKLSESADMVWMNKEMKEVFRRTKIVNCTSSEMTIEVLAEFGQKILCNAQSLLIICNTKKEAVDLFKRLSLVNNVGYELFHLSTSMCMQHRKDTLIRINECLEGRQKMICVATQLVEAGIDFSFESVIRIIAGMDNLAQAAGRCNRSGEFPHICNVYLVDLKNERLGPLKDIQLAQECTINFLQAFEKNKGRFHNNLLSQESIRDYYIKLFNELSNENHLAYQIKDKFGIQDKLFYLLAANEQHANFQESQQYNYFLNQSFLTAGENFKVYDSNTVDVIVPYNEAAIDIINDLCSAKAKFDLVYQKQVLSRAKQYSVQIWENQIAKMQNGGMLHTDENGYFITLLKQWYEPNLGVCLDNYMI